MSFFPGTEKIWYTVVEPNTRDIQFYNPVLNQTATYYTLPPDAIIERQSRPTRSKRRRHAANADPMRLTLTPKTYEQYELNLKHSRPINKMNTVRARKNNNEMRKNAKRAEEREMMEQQEAESKKLRNNEHLENSLMNLEEMISENLRPPEVKKYYKARQKVIVNMSKAINRHMKKGGCGCGFGGNRSTKRSTRHSASKRSTKKRSTRH